MCKRDSLRPLHDLCMCTEAARVGQMIYYCLKRERATIYEFKTDSVLHRPLKRRKTNVLLELTFRDLSTLRDRYEGRNNRLNQHSVVTPIPSDDKVYRVAKATEADLMCCEPDVRRQPRRQSPRSPGGSSRGNRPSRGCCSTASPC